MTKSTSGDLKPEGPALDDMKRIVFEAIGEASMCWSEAPTGIFESTRAKAIGENVMKAISTYIHQAEERARNDGYEAGLKGFDDLAKAQEPLLLKARAAAGEECANIAEGYGKRAHHIATEIRRHFGIKK